MGSVSQIWVAEWIVVPLIEIENIGPSLDGGVGGEHLEFEVYSYPVVSTNSESADSSKCGLKILKNNCNDNKITMQ